MKLLTAMLALFVGTGAFAGERTIWQGNLYISAANVWASTGWLPVVHNGVETTQLTIKSTGTYCDLRVADPIQYSSVSGGRTYYAYFNAVVGGYVIDQGRVAEVNFNLYQNLTANIYCTLRVDAKVADDHGGSGFNYRDADHASNMLALGSLNMNLSMKKYRPDYDHLQNLIEALEASSQDLRRLIKDREPFFFVEREFYKVQRAYNAFADEFIPFHSDVKQSYLDLRGDFRSLQVLFQKGPMPEPQALSLP